MVKTVDLRLNPIAIHRCYVILIMNQFKHSTHLDGLLLPKIEEMPLSCIDHEPYLPLPFSRNYSVIARNLANIDIKDFSFLTTLALDNCNLINLDFLSSKQTLDNMKMY